MTTMRSHQRRSAEGAAKAGEGYTLIFAPCSDDSSPPLARSLRSSPPLPRALVQASRHCLPRSPSRRDRLAHPLPRQRCARRARDRARADSRSPRSTFARSSQAIGLQPLHDDWFQHFALRAATLDEAQSSLSDQRQAARHPQRLPDAAGLCARERRRRCAAGRGGIRRHRAGVASRRLRRHRRARKDRGHPQRRAETVSDRSARVLLVGRREAAQRGGARRGGDADDLDDDRRSAQSVREARAAEQHRADDVSRCERQSGRHRSKRCEARRR